MKKLVLGILTVFSVTSNAQTAGFLTLPCTGDVTVVTPTTAPKPICIPAPKGKGTSPIIEVNTAGVAGGWWCKQLAPKPPLLYLYAVRWSAIDTSLVLDLTSIALAGAATAKIQEITLRRQNDSILNMCDVWGPAKQRLLDAKPVV